MGDVLFAGVKRIEGRAWMLGERIDVRGFERGRTLAPTPLTVQVGQRGCAVLFRYGAVALFHLDSVEETAFLHNLRPFVIAPFEETEHEDVEIEIDPGRDERVGADGVLRLHEPSLERLQVVAEILAKSAVLAHYEERVARVFDNIEPLAADLQAGHRRSVHGRELLRQMGDALLTQTRTVGRVEVTEKPELTWDRADLDRLYERLSTEYELRERDLALGRKLELISRTASTLLDLIHTRRALRVEWYIVLLILFEVVLILYDMFGMG